MSKLIFTPEMFKRNDLMRGSSHENIAEDAQKHFEKWLSGQPLAYCYGYGNPMDSKWNLAGLRKPEGPQYNGDIDKSYTHIARLVDIQPIKKVKCEHPHYKITNEKTCGLCGIKMKWTCYWEPEEKE